VFHDDRQPISDAEVKLASNAIQELREEVRNDLPAELGRELDNYRADQYCSPADDTDGGSD
jgi:hypothetical protein